jgi:hypothetical protein
VPEGVNHRGERETRTGQGGGDSQKRPRPIPVGEGTHRESGGAPKQEVDGQRHRDRPSTPAELLSQGREKDTEGGEGDGEGERHREQRGDDPPSLIAGTHVTLLSALS